MDKVSLIEQVQSDSRLFSMPQVMSELLAESSKEDFTVASLARIIRGDASLTGRILRLANSPFYGRVSKVKTIDDAVAVLGGSTVKCFALATSIFRPELIQGESSVDPQSLASFSLSVSVAAESIAKTIDYHQREEALVTGLLHDLGVVYLLHHYPKEYATVLAKQDRGSSLCEAERSVFGLDHCELGSHMAIAWRLPNEMTEAIAGHHDMEDIEGESVLNRIVKLAVLITFDRFSDHVHYREERVRRIRVLSDTLGISNSQIGDVTQNMYSRAAKMADSFGVAVGDNEELLAKANREIWKSYLAIEHVFKERQELAAKLLTQERRKGALEAKRIDLATLSHYLSNAVAIISGQAQLLDLLQQKGMLAQKGEQVSNATKSINRSVTKVMAVMKAMREISPTDEIEFFEMSSALRIDDRIEKCMEELAKEDPAQFFMIPDGPDQIASPLGDVMARE
ncbi:MAG: HDOD domain-containing protein [bacterium]